MPKTKAKPKYAKEFEKLQPLWKEKVMPGAEWSNFDRIEAKKFNDKIIPLLVKHAFPKMEWSVHVVKHENPTIYTRYEEGGIYDMYKAAIGEDFEVLFPECIYDGWSRVSGIDFSLCTPWERDELQCDFFIQFGSFDDLVKFMKKFKLKVAQ